MSVGSAAGAGWLAGAAIGTVGGVLLAGWLPLPLKVALIVVIALALNLPRTRGSRGMQAGFLVMAGAPAFVVLGATNLLAGPVAALSVGALALGFWRTLELVNGGQSA